MRFLPLLSFLPVFLLPSAESSPASEWSQGAPPSEKYWPDGTGPPSKRWLEQFEENLRNNRSTRIEGLYGLRKMGFDPDEKFFDHYWGWGAEGEGGSMKVLGLREAFAEEKRGQADVLELDRRQEGNVVAEINVRNMKRYNPPQRKSLETSPAGILAILKRQTFVCASGSYACTSIGRSGSCCAQNEVCASITDIGYGDVGCCPNGQACTGNLSGCSADQVTCSSDLGGGCCISGTVCTSNGCVAESVTPSSTSNDLSKSTATICSSGHYSCPSNLAGGCCPSGRLCGVSDCPSPTVTEAPNVIGDTCPTGYYTCAPQYNGGCCRIGRDCGITNCPLRSSTTTLANGAVAAPTDQGRCASGWVTCPAGLGGGCCPSGYQCGVTDCPATTVTAGQTTIVLAETTKLPATAVGAAGNGRRVGVGEVVVAVVAVLGVVAV
ncbi:hypothetical protein RUND412_004520 [Rhizina undulata]